MMKHKRFILICTVFLFFIIIYSVRTNSPEIIPKNHNSNKSLAISASLEGAENIVITDIDRRANITKSGLLSIKDTLTIKNLNNNPISSISFCIPSDISEDLIFLKTSGIDEDTLLAERSHMIVNDYEMIVVYFNSPLLPHQSKTIKVLQIYKNLIKITRTIDQRISYSGLVYPVLPYKSEGAITAFFRLPETGSDVQFGWGVWIDGASTIRYDFQTLKDMYGVDFIAPFLENVGNDKGTDISFVDESFFILEMKEISREILISPWGIIRIKDEFTIENLGFLSIDSVSLDIPIQAKDVTVSDDLGEMDIKISSAGNKERKDLTINFIKNRIKLIPDTTYRFKVEYYLPFEEYYSLNWFQGSIQLDILTTKFDFLGRHQTIKIIIDGCSKINYITEPPEAIKESQGTLILTYESDYITPYENRVIQFTFTIDFFDLLLRPIIFMLLISFIASIYVLTVKLRKKERETTILKREFIPVNEIREFCSLYEEKNALVLEIRQAEEDARRKKIAKKNYKNILDKNTSKIDEIQQEINPFKKALLETNITFENVIKRFDLLEAERISVNDSLNLLESRYKRGRLPSRAAYLKLSDNFKKRRKKIERNIDKLIQQLRSYLL